MPNQYIDTTGALNALIATSARPNNAWASGIGALGDGLQNYQKEKNQTKAFNLQQSLLQNQDELGKKQLNWFDNINQASLENKKAQTNNIQANTADILNLAPLKTQQAQANINNTKANTTAVLLKSKGIDLDNRFANATLPYRTAVTKTEAEKQVGNNILMRDIYQDLYYQKDFDDKGKELYDSMLKRTALGDSAFRGDLSLGKNTDQLFSINKSIGEYAQKNNLPTLDGGTRIDFSNLTPEQYNQFAPYAQALFKLTPLTSNESKELSNYSSMGSQLKTITKNYNPSDSGLVQNSLNQVNKYIGLGDDISRNAKVRSATQGLYNVIIKQTAGTAVSKAEEARLANEIGNLNQSDKAFLSALRQTLEQKIAGFEPIRNKNPHYVDYVTRGLYDGWNKNLKLIDDILNENDKRGMIDVRRDIVDKKAQPNSTITPPNPSSNKPNPRDFLIP